MKRIAAWILAASLAIGLLAGCGAKSTDKTTTPAPTTAPTTPVKKAEPQELTLNVGSELSTLDSAKITDTGSSDMANQIFEGLGRRDANGDIKKGSGAAQDWTISADGLTYTFKLKDNLKWSDGQPLTSKDFKYGWLRGLDPNTASDYAFILEYIKGGTDFANLSLKDADFAKKYADLKAKVGIQTPDDKTFVVTLENPTPYFLGLMNFSNYYPQRQDIVEKFGDKYAADADKLVYNGPFVLKTWQHDAEMVLEKNATYWDAATVKLTKITYKMVADQNTFVNMFEAGQLDSMGLSGAMVAQYKDKPGFQREASATTWYLQFNLGTKDKTFLNNLHIRQAFSYALDRQNFVDNILQNGSLPATALVPSSIHLNGASFRSLSKFDPLPAKPDAAKAAAELALGLKDLGMDKLPPIDFLSNLSDTAKKQAQAIQAMIQQNLPGMQLNITPVDPKVRLARIAKGDFEVALAGWGGDYDDPMTFLDYWTTGNPQNSGKWSNKEYDQLVKDLATTTDGAKRLEMFKRQEQIILTEMPIVPLWWPAVSRVRKPYYKGTLTFPVGPGSDLKYAYIEGKQQ